MQPVPPLNPSLERIIFLKVPPELQKEIVSHLSPYDLLGRFGVASKGCQIAVKPLLSMVVKDNITLHVPLTAYIFGVLKEIVFLNLKLCQFDSGCIQQVNQLNQLTQIRQLDLFGTDISNLTLPGMATALTNLERLDIRGTKVTYTGRENLKRVRPNIEILAWVDY